MDNLNLIYSIRSIKPVKKFFDSLPQKMQKFIRRILLKILNKKRIDSMVKIEKFKNNTIPKVSIVLPNFNHKKYLRNAINSILNQNYPNFELIIVDDGSTDTSEQIIMEFENNARVKIVLNKHVGLWAALNCGFKYAEGDFLTWISADNFIEPGAIDFHVGSLKLRPEVGMVYSDYQVVNEQGEPFTNSDYRRYDQNEIRTSVIANCRKETLLNSIPDNFIGPFFMYRREVAETIGQYRNLEGFEDYDYWLRISTRFHIWHIHTNEVMYNYRLHKNTLTSRAKELKTYARLSEYLGEELWRK